MPLKRYILHTLILVCSLPLTNINGQEARSENFMGLGSSYGLDIAAGDLSDRFGQSFHAGLSLELFRIKWNGLFSFEASINFGDNVKQDVLSAYRLENGSILGNNGSYADVFLRQRGAYLGIMANKIIFSVPDNPHAGFALGLGLGYLQHNIRFQVDSSNAPQFEGDYAKGYDRNSAGIASKQAISYLHIGKNKAVNFEIALYVTEGFTTNRRAFNFDTAQSDSESRLDILIGLDVKWILPIKDQQAAGEIFY